MAWYFYNGTKPLAVPTGGGEVVAVRPGTKVYVDPSIETRADFRRLQGVLKRTSGPRPDAAVVEVEAPALERSADPFSSSIVEGVKPGSDVNTPFAQSVIASGDGEKTKDAAATLTRLRKRTAKTE